MHSQASLSEAGAASSVGAAGTGSVNTVVGDFVVARMPGSEPDTLEAWLVVR